MDDPDLPDRDDVVAHKMNDGQTSYVLMYEKANVYSWMTSDTWIQRDEAV